MIDKMLRTLLRRYIMLRFIFIYSLSLFVYLEVGYNLIINGFIETVQRNLNHYLENTLLIAEIIQFRARSSHLCSINF